MKNDQSFPRWPQWVYLALLMLCYVMVGINTYRLQPVLTTIMESLSIDESAAGILMSAGSFVTLCFAIPFGFVVAKLGCRKTMACAIVLEIAGSLVGGYFTQYTGIVISQLILGASSTVATVCAPYLLQMVYSREKYSTATGYLNSCQTVGMAVTFLFLPALVRPQSISGAWLMTVIPAAALFLLWLFILDGKSEAALRQQAEQRERQAELPDDGAAAAPALSTPPVRDPKVWAVALGTFFIMFSVGAVLSFASAYLTAERGIPEAVAARIVLSSAIVGMFSSAAGGWICNQIGKRNTYLFVVFLLAALRLLMVMVPKGFPLYIVMALQGVPAASIVAVTAAVPELCPAIKHRPFVISLFSTANMAGTCVSAALFGIMIIQWGYRIAFLSLVAVSFLALVGVRALPAKH